MNISPSQLSSDRDPSRVEAQVRIAVFQSNRTEEIIPSFRGALWADVGFRYASATKLPKERNKLLMEPGYVCFAAFCTEGYASDFNVNVPHWVKVGFRNPTTLIPSNLEAVGKKSSHWLWLL